MIVYAAAVIGLSVGSVGGVLIGLWLASRMREAE